MSPSSVSAAIIETCEALIFVLQDYLKVSAILSFFNFVCFTNNQFYLFNFLLTIKNDRMSMACSIFQSSIAISDSNYDSIIISDEFIMDQSSIPS